jgi:hypothetical protein
MYIMPVLSNAFDTGFVRRFPREHGILVFAAKSKIHAKTETVTGPVSSNVER